MCDNILFVLLVWLESGLARMRVGGFYWTRPGELGARPKWKALV